MKALTLDEPGRVNYEDVPEPALIDATDALVRVEASAVCGSDLHVYHGRIAGIRPHVPIGHEFIGVVEDTGSLVSRFSRGQRVTGSFFAACGSCSACRRQWYTQCEHLTMFGFGDKFGGLFGTQAEWVRVPYADTTLIAVPDTMSLEAGITAGDIAATAYFATSRAHIHPGDRVAVVGLGPVGLLCVEMAAVFGASEVLALDTVPERLESARRLGAVPITADDSAAKVVLSMTGGRGADAVIEAVGSEPALQLAVRIARGFAHVSSAGVYTERGLSVAMGRMFSKDLTIASGMCNVPAVADAVMALIESGRIHPERVFTHRLTLSDGPSAYERFAKRLTGKILLSVS